VAWRWTTTVGTDYLPPRDFILTLTMKKEKTTKRNQGPILHDRTRLMFAVVQEDEYGQILNIFLTKKQAETFLKELNITLENKKYEKRNKI